MTIDELIKLSDHINVLYKQQREAYEQMKRYEDHDSDMYFFHAGVHANISVKVDNIVARLKEIKNETV